MPEPPVIELRDVKKVYDMGEVKEEVLRGMTLKVNKGEFVAIIGASGSGKSTLLHIMGLLDRPTSGKVFLNGKDTSYFSDNKLANERGKNIGFVFQFFNLYSTINVIENVMLPMMIQGKKKIERIKRAKELLKLVGLSEREEFMPSQLSGGQRQRVAIARALAMRPDILFADEPTGNLDSKTGKDVIDMLVDISKDKERTIIMITHDYHVAHHANRVIEIKDGKVISDKKNSKSVGKRL